MKQRKGKIRNLANIAKLMEVSESKVRKMIRDEIIDVVPDGEFRTITLGSVKMLLQEQIKDMEAKIWGIDHANREVNARRNDQSAGGQNPHKIRGRNTRASQTGDNGAK